MANGLTGVIDHGWFVIEPGATVPLTEGLVEIKELARKAGVDVRLGGESDRLTWVAKTTNQPNTEHPDWTGGGPLHVPGKIIGVAQAWRVGKTHPCDGFKQGGTWRMSGLFVRDWARGYGVGFALQKARFDCLRDVYVADSIDSFAFKPAPLVALGFSPVRVFQMGTTRVLWRRKKEGLGQVNVRRTRGQGDLW